MKSISKSKKAQFRRNILASACAMAVMAPSAFAQTTATFTFAGGTINPASSLGTYIQQVLLDQIDGSNNLGAFTLQQSVTANTNFVQTSPLLVNNNTNQAFTFGNVALEVATVSVAGSSNSVGNLLGQAVTTTALNASANNVDGGVSLLALPPSTNTVKGNTIQAVVGANTSTVLIAKNPDPNPIYDDTGKLTNYTNATLGSLSVTEGASISTTTTGSLAAVSNQVAFAAGVLAGSNATVTDSSLSLSTPFVTGDITPNQTLDSNTIAAGYSGNSATVAVAIDAGSTALNGSATAGNFQGNLDAGAGAKTDLTASVSTSGITTDLRYGPGGSVNILGAVTTSSNAVTATSTGNAGDTSITLGTGVNLNGPGSTRVNSLDAVARTADVAADLGLLSVQGNTQTGFNSSVDGGTVRVFADNVGATGTLTLSSNSVGSAATGNTASNLIQTAATSVVGSVAAGNMQLNDDTTLTSTTSNAEISSNVGVTGIASFGPVTVSNNGISAASTGSTATTQVLLDATNALTLTSTGAGASVNSAGDGIVGTTAGTGATASNFQANYGTDPITSTVSGSNIRADFFNATANARTSLSGAEVTVSNNGITSDATGNQATTSLALGTVDSLTNLALSGNVTGSAAIANGQLNESPLTANVSDSGIRVRALDAVDSEVTASSNKIAATATGNDAANTLSSASMDTLTVLATPFAVTGTARVDSGAQTAESGGALAIASSQKNTGNLAAANTTSGQFVVVDVSSATGTLPSAGIDSSKLTVSSNDVSATGIANNVTNTLQASVANSLATSDGTAGQVASIANLQQNTNTTTGQQSAVLSSTAPLSIGIVYGEGDVTSTNSTTELTVSSNLASASLTGNKAVNQLGISTQNYGGTGSSAGVVSSTPGTGVNFADSEFAVVNRQTDDVSGGAGRLVIVSGITAGIDIHVPVTGGGNISDTNLTVSSNTIEGSARANDADNSLLLAGKSSSNLTTSAGLLNSQSTSTVTNVNSFAPVTASQIMIKAGSDFTLDNNQITLSDNTISSTAEGNVANNLLGVVATNLTGNATVATGSSITGGSGLLTMNSDFALGNVQAASGPISSFVDGSVGANFLGSDAVGGQITLSNNTVQAVSRANQATNTNLLTGVGNVSNISGTASIASYQTGSAAVTATQITSGADNATIGIVGATTDGTMLTVSNNAVSAVAEQNTATNNLVVSGTNITGAGLTGLASYVPATTVATTGSDFAVLNVQLGSGTLSASSTPGVIGTRIGGLDGGSATISDNVVLAMATVNTANNSLVLSAVNALNATGSVNNVQTSAGPAASATVSGATVGVALPTGGLTPVTIDGTPVTISGNSLTASSGGNTASNSLLAATVPTIGGSALPTFQVLNSQTNAASMTSLVDAVSVGLPISLAGSSISNANLSISGNQVLALGYGNNARSTLTTSSLIGSASSWLTSTQRNTGNISTTVSNATLGVTGALISSTGGVTGSVSGNTITAQSVGNSAVNILTTSK